jgi:hypothetical protein
MRCVNDFVESLRFTILTVSRIQYSICLFSVSVAHYSRCFLKIEAGVGARKDFERDCLELGMTYYVCVIARNES